jgi:hypothetical protein
MRLVEINFPLLLVDLLFSLLIYELNNIAYFPRRSPPKLQITKERDLHLHIGTKQPALEMLLQFSLYLFRMPIPS